MINIFDCESKKLFFVNLQNGMKYTVCKLGGKKSKSNLNDNLFS